MFAKLLHPGTPREVVRNVAVGAAGLIAGTWLVALLTQLNWFNDPKHQVREVAQYFGWLTSQGWFLVLSGLAVGFALGVWMDAYLVRRNSKIWWQHLQAFSIKDAACLLSGIKRSEFEKSDRANALANELRGYVNSGHVPLFLEIEFERAPRDWSDPSTRYEPPYDKKDVGFDAVISKRFIQDIAIARKWPLPWSVPPNERGGESHIKPLARPTPPRVTNALLGAGKSGGMFAAGSKKGNEKSPSS
jgi:hypothetical protein